jgi:predicted O-methyltransferase YrrM
MQPRKFRFTEARQGPFKRLLIIAVGLGLMFAFDQMAPRPIPHSANNNSVPLDCIPSNDQMRSFQQMFNDTTSDKGSIHSYLQLYQHLFASKRMRARNVLEIGAANGGSILMWHEYFMNAVVWGLDRLTEIPQNMIELSSSPRARIIYGQDAYNRSFVERTFVDTNITLDVFIDDGPHFKDSMEESINLYLPILAPDGIFVIEDVAVQKWLVDLYRRTPIEDRKYVEMFDMSGAKDCPDDIAFVINREIY